MNNDRIIILLINDEDSNPLYNKLSTIIIRAPTLDEDTNIQSTRLQPVLFQAPNWTSRGSNLVTLRDQPLGIQPYLWYKLQLGLLEDSYPLGLQPTTSIRQDKFNDSLWFPISSAKSLDNIFKFNTALKRSPKLLAHQWQFCLLRRCHQNSSWYPKKYLQGHLMMASTHHGLQ